MLWEKSHTLPPWIEANTGATFHPMQGEAGWTGRRYHLGRNKEVYDAELYALYRALQTFDSREEWNRRYTISSNSSASID